MLNLIDKYNLISQAHNHRAKFNLVDSAKAIDNYKKKQSKEKSDEYKLKESIIANEQISEKDNIVNINQEEILDDTCMI